MNPLYWKREHQIAWLVVCILGAISGVLCAWLDSPIYWMPGAANPGEPADSMRAFLRWLPQIDSYWRWPVFGGAIAGLAFYARHLLRD